MKKNPLNSSNTPLPTDGRESSLQKKEAQIKSSTLTSIVRISTRSNITPSQAWELGTNVRSAFKHCPKETHTALTALLKGTLDYLDYNKTIRQTEHIIEAVDHLIHEFPAMKLEEWKCVMMNFKTGKYGKQFERLMLPELVEAFQQYEGERAERREAQWKQLKKKPEGEPLTQEQKDLMKRLLADLDLPEPDTDQKGRWDFIPHPNTPEEEK
jgi:hypothetical protein